MTCWYIFMFSSNLEIFFQLLVYLQAGHVNYISCPSNYLKSAKIYKVFLCITLIHIINQKSKSSHGKGSKACHAIIHIHQNTPWNIV